MHGAAAGSERKRKEELKRKEEKKSNLHATTRGGKRGKRETECVLNKKFCAHLVSFSECGRI